MQKLLFAWAVLGGLTGAVLGDELIQPRLDAPDPVSRVNPSYEVPAPRNLRPKPPTLDGPTSRPETTPRPGPHPIAEPRSYRLWAP